MSGRVVPTVARILVRIQPGDDYADLHRMTKREWERHVCEAFAIERDDVIVTLLPKRKSAPAAVDNGCPCGACQTGMGECTEARAAVDERDALYGASIEFQNASPSSTLGRAFRAGAAWQADAILDAVAEEVEKLARLAPLMPGYGYAPGYLLTADVLRVLRGDK